MRIISKFNDYYDSVQSYGQSDVIYQRKRVDILLDTNHSLYDFCKKITDTGLLIGIAGKIYPCIKVERTYATHKIYEVDEIKFCYSEYDFHDFMKRHKDEDKYLNPNLWGKSIQSKVKEFFDYDYSSLTDIFYDYNVPIFSIDVLPIKSHIIRDISLILNPCLKDYKFVSQKDTFTTFQELEMFVSGVLKTPVKPILLISDECMRDAKGFDKWSFKKMPTKKR